MPNDNLPLQMFREYRSALDQMMFFAQFAAPGDIAFCVGAGGAGKSRLAKLIGPMVYGGSETWAPGTRPFVLVQLDTPDRAYFSPKAFIRDCLLCLDDPFRAGVEHIATWPLAPEIKERLIRITSVQSPRSYGEPEMRIAFINLARLLGVKLLLVDEANMMTLTQVNRIPTDYLESLRRLGDRIGCPVILLGTIRLLKLLGHSAQLNRRTFRVHLARMSCLDEVGAMQFLSFVKGIEDAYKLDSGLLTGQVEAVHEWTYGIPGEVVGLVDRARIYAAAEGSAIEWSHMQKAKHLPEALKRMVTEADIIESTMEGTPEPEAPRERTKKPKKARPNMKAKLTPNRGYAH